MSNAHYCQVSLIGCRRENNGPQQATKRKSNQASLDSPSGSSSSSSASSLQPFRFGVDNADRPLLRIPKRPRLLGSPFDPTKAVTFAPVARPAVFRKGRTSILLSLEHGGPRRIPDTPEVRSTSSAPASSVGSGPGSAGPQRSGLPMGDLFSPESNRTRSSSVDFGLRGPDDILVEDEDD